MYVMHPISDDEIVQAFSDSPNGNIDFEKN